MYGRGDILSPYGIDVWLRGYVESVGHGDV